MPWSHFLTSTDVPVRESLRLIILAFFRICLGKFSYLIFSLQLFSFGVEALALNTDLVDLEFALQITWLLAPLGTSLFGFCLFLVEPQGGSGYFKTLTGLKFLFD